MPTSPSITHTDERQILLVIPPGISEPKFCFWQQVEFSIDKKQFTGCVVGIETITEAYAKTIGEDVGSFWSYSVEYINQRRVERVWLDEEDLSAT